MLLSDTTVLMTFRMGKFFSRLYIFIYIHGCDCKTLLRFDWFQSIQH